MSERDESTPDPGGTRQEAGGGWMTFGLFDQVREFILRDAEQRARTTAPEILRELRRLNDAAERRIVAVRQLDSPLTRVVECGLLRDASRLLEAGRRMSTATSPQAEALPSPIDAQVPDLTYDELPPAELEAERARLWDAVVAARTGLEVRSPAFIRGTRFGRIGALVLVVGWLLGSRISAALKPPNLALGKPVTVSSQFPGTRNPSGVVDGDTGGTFGVHTKSEDGPWVMIDLQSQYVVHEVKVYNRGDGWFDVGLPLAIEISIDGVHWVEAGRRATHFDQNPPWDLVPIDRPGRYVRLHVVGKGIISLRQVEVFGHKQ